MIGIVSFLGTSVIQLAPAMAKEMFGVGRGAYGILVAAFGLGAVTGSVLIAFIADRMHRSVVARHRHRRACRSASSGWVSRPSTGWASPRCTCMGLMYLLLATSLNTGVQARVEDEFRGRVMAIYLSSLLLGVPLGALIQGKAGRARSTCGPWWWARGCCCSCSRRGRWSGTPVSARSTSRWSRSDRRCRPQPSAPAR